MSAQAEASARPKAPEMIPGASGLRTPIALIAILIALTLIGVVGFIIGVMTETEPHAWQAFLVNFLFFLGVAEGGVVVSASFYLTQARWGGPGAYRLAESFYIFIPVAFVLFWVLFFGRAELWPWVTRPALAKNPTWLNTPFFFAREGFALLALTALSMWFVRVSQRVDVRQWALSNDNIAMPPAAIRRIAPALALTYAAVMSLIAFDLIMSLAPQWKSTLFGAFFFVGAFWSAIVAMALTAVVLRGRLGPGNLFTRDSIMHDLGKFVFAFSVFWAYTLFAQYIVIWYGDIPAETFFLVVRGAIIGGPAGYTLYTPWMIPTWIVPLLVWVIPFTMLMGVKPKKTPAILGSVAFLGLIGMWLERYVLVVPSIEPHHIPFNWIELAVTLGFLGIFGLCAIPGMKLTIAAATAPGVLEAAEE
jgi:hypothetical protein